MQRRTIKITVLTGLLALSSAAGSAPATSESAPVMARPLQELVLYPEKTAPATCYSVNDSRISTEVSARITEIPVRVGETVARGDVIARLDPRDYELQVAQAQAALRGTEARLKLAEYELQRAEALIDKKAIAKELLQQRQADVNNLQAERDSRRAALDRAKRDLARTTLRAPFKGVVLERLGKVGELVAPGTPVIRLLDMEHIEVSADIRTRDVASLQRAAQISFVAENEQHPLRLRIITPAVHERERSRDARLEFVGQAALPGTPGRLSWRDGEPHIAPDFVVRRSGRLGLFALNGERARFVALSEAEEGRPAKISLPLDSLIITEGRYTLKDGDRVRRQ